jgi:DNA invertase Pin-like site-specific DNA recombinase
MRSRPCRIHGAKLVIAKLDRLARNAHFLLGLQEAGVEFIAVDMPTVNRMVVGILALVAEDEAKRISERTKAALAAAKRRGVKLGGIREGHKPFSAKASMAGVRARVERANARAADLAPIINELQAAGIASLRGIADELNARGIPTANGQTWQAMQVSRVLARV